MSKRKTILITGFGPFPGAKENPSGHLVNALGAMPNLEHFAGVSLVCGVLPTSWQNVKPALIDLLDKHSPDLSLHLGYASSSPGFQLETTAYNQTCIEDDVDGVAGSCCPISSEGPGHLQSALPVQDLQQQLATKGFKATLSDDPGRYLCNMAYYLALNRSPARSALFVHIPAIEMADKLAPNNHKGQHRLSLAEAQQGLLALLDTLVKECA